MDPAEGCGPTVALLGEGAVLLALVPTYANESEPGLCFLEVAVRGSELVVISGVL